MAIEDEIPTRRGLTITVTRAFDSSVRQGLLPPRVQSRTPKQRTGSAELVIHARDSTARHAYLNA